MFNQNDMYLIKTEYKDTIDRPYTLYFGKELKFIEETDVVSSKFVLERSVCSSSVRYLKKRIPEKIMFNNCDLILMNKNTVKYNYAYNILVDVVDKEN